jgi:nitroreductase
MTSRQQAADADTAVLVPPLDDEDVRRVVALASRAPSVHNTQPWSFSWDGRSLRVREDASRALPVLDPQGRERVVSCGAAVLHARVALAGLALQVRTDLLPDPSDPALLAVLTVVGRGPADRLEQSLAQAVTRRATSRERFAVEQVPDDVLEALHAAAEAESAWLRVLGREGRDDLAALQLLLDRADEQQRCDPSYLAELASWRREAADGVPEAALPTEPVGRRASSWALRDFASPATAPAPDDQGDPAPAEHPTVLVLGTEGDDRAAWLAAGQALGRVLLTATSHGVAAQPLTQLIEVPVLRERARAVLGVLGYPQLLLRVGYADPLPRTRRRLVDEVLDLDAGRA